MKHYDDIDYDQFLYPHRNPDFQPDLHWNFLPASEIAQIAVANPPQHKIILVPTDPNYNYSPTEDELWPAVHQAVAAVSKVIADHRGWRNPQPYNTRLRFPTPKTPTAPASAISIGTRIYLVMRARRVAKRVFSRDSRGNCRRMGAIKEVRNMGMPREREIASHSI